MPRGRLPSLTVATTFFVASEITERSPERSFVTKRRGPAGMLGGALGFSATGDGDGWPEQAASRTRAASGTAPARGRIRLRERLLRVRVALLHFLERRAAL